MRHRKAGVKLNRTSSHRKAMFRNMVTSLIKHEKIRTTDAKAKEIRKWADHLITLAKRGDLHARRQALSIVREKDVVHKLFEEAPKRYGAVAGGYTRVVKIGRRPGDAAPMSLVELVAAQGKVAKPVPKKKAKPPAKEPVQDKGQSDAGTTPAAEASAETDAEDAAADTEEKSDPDESKTGDVSTEK